MKIRSIANIRVLLTLCVLVCIASNAYADGKNTYNSSLTVTPSPKGAGLVYVGKSSGTPISGEAQTVSQTKEEKESEKSNHTYYVNAKVTKDGYKFLGWAENESTNILNKTANTTFNLTSNENLNKAKYFRYAIFARMTGDPASNSTINFGEVVGNQKYQKEIVITHAHADKISITAPNGFTVFPTATESSASEKETTITITFDAKEIGTYKGTLTISSTTDGLDPLTYNLEASVAKIAQSLESWNIQETYTVADKVTLQAKTNIGKTDFTFSVVSSTPNDIVQIDGNTMTFKGTGTATIQAYQAGGGLYDAFTTTQTITINKATPTIVTTPTASNISYTQVLGESNLSGGQATINWQGNENTHVEGHFQWKQPMLVPSANNGNPQQQTLVFVPNREDLYNRVECRTTLTVAQINQTLTWNQDLPTTVVEGEQIPLTTHVTSGRPISYTFSPDYLGEQFTKVVATNPDTLIALQRGKGTVTAVCPGDADYKESNAITKTYTYWDNHASLGTCPIW